MGYFAVAFSDKQFEDAAAKELSLEVKKALLQTPDLALIFYSSNYKPALLYDILHITLRPKHIIGIKAPLIIYQDRISEKGVSLVCFRGRELNFHPCLLEELSSEKVEVKVRDNLRKLKQLKLLCSFISPSVDPREYMRGIRLALGKNMSFISAGFTDIEKNGPAHIFDTYPGNKVLHLECGGDLSVKQQRITGFIPLCRPFTLSKVDVDRNIILEINGKPASDIYKTYLDNKYDLFVKKEMYKVYPLGIESGGSYHLISVKKILGDDSLLYEGSVCQGDQATLLIYNQDALKEKLNQAVRETRQSISPQLLFVVNSSLNQHFRKKELEEETRSIKKAAGEQCQVIGLYSDYHIAYNRAIRELVIEEGAMHLTFLNLK